MSTCLKTSVIGSYHVCLIQQVVELESSGEEKSRRSSPPAAVRNETRKSHRVPTGEESYFVSKCNKTARELKIRIDYDFGVPEIKGKTNTDPYYVMKAAWCSGEYRNRWKTRRQVVGNPILRIF